MKDLEQELHDHAGNKDYVDRWQEAYDPKGAIKALHSAIVKLKEARGNTA